MINLLPKSERVHIKKEYKLRVLVLVLKSFLILEVLTAGLFFPSYYIITQRVKGSSDELEAKKKLIPPENAAAASQITEIKGEIVLLKPGAEATPETLPSALLTQVLATKPDGIGISSFAYAVTPTLSVQLTGISATREDLLQYQRDLKNNPHVTDAKYGESFITKKSDIPFTLTITAH